jgi:hypothetical protein
MQKTANPNTRPAPEPDHPPAYRPIVCTTAVCSTCGPTSAVRVQSHDQCARCGRVLESCCEGG